MHTLPDTPHGHFTHPDPPPYSQGAVAVLVCDPGYVPSTTLHQSTLTLLPQGQLAWSAAATCDPATTQDLPTAVNGHFEADPPYLPGTIAKLVCDPYHLPQSSSGSLLTLYQGRLIWSPATATCIPILHELPPAQRGHFKCDQPPPYTEGAVAKLRCDPGYRTHNVTQAVARKRHDGRLVWDPPSASCTPVACPVPPDPGNHGDRIGSDFTFPNAVSYKCHEGYKLNTSTPPAYYCSAEGNWQPAIPHYLTCSPVECPILEHPAHGRVQHPYPSYLALATYTCDPGYEIAGGPERVCQAHGYWSGEPASCVQPSCTLLPEMAPVKIADPNRVVLDCGQGREDTILCVNGKWSKKPPYCNSDPKPPRRNWIPLGVAILVFLVVLALLLMR